MEVQKWAPVDPPIVDPPNIEFPLMVISGTEVPPDGPPPYSSDNETGDLYFFHENATPEEWARYDQWVQEMAEWRRSPDGDVAIIDGELITDGDVFTLKKSAWIMDNILHYVFKSLKGTLGVTDPLVAFFPSFFFTKLYQEGHQDPAREDKYLYAGVASWTKRFLKGKSIDQMKTVVFLFNEGCSHWICFAIFLDLKIIQAFDSMGCRGGDHLKNLYRWLHQTMEIAGKLMNPKEWRLYTTRRDTPRQSDHDCGLYAVLFGMCVAMRLPLSLITRGRIRAARVFLLLHLIDLQPERAKPLGEGDEFKPKYDKEGKRPSLDTPSSPDRPSRELADDSGGPVVDLLTPPTKNEGARIESTDSVLDLITPDKNPIQETNGSVTDLVTPPTKRQLDLSVNDSGEGGGGTGASQEADSAGASGENKNQDEAEKSKGSGSAQGGGGSSSGNTAVGSPNASGGGADDGGKGSDDNDGDEKNDDDEKDPKSKKDKPKKSPPAGKKDGKGGDSGTEGNDKKEVNEDVGDLPIISGIILPFVDSTGVTKKNHGLYGTAIQEHSQKNTKASRLKLKKRKDIFQKSWVAYQKRLAKYIDKGEKHEDEDVCVACAEMADKKIVCKKCNVCVHPVVPCSHTIEKEYFCESCFNLPSDNPSTTSKKDAPSKPGASPQLEDEADPEAKANPEASGGLPQPEDEEEDANPNLEEESNKKKKRKRRPRTKRGGLPSRTSPRNKQKPTETAGATDDSDKKAVVKELFKSNEKQGTVPVETIPRKKQNLGKPTGPPPPNKDDFVPPKEQEVDDPLSRIDPSPPLVPEAKLPAKSDAATDKVDDAETDKVDDDLKLPADSVRGDPKAAKSDAATDKVDDAETDKVDDDLKLPADSVRGDAKAKSKKKQKPALPTRTSPRNKQGSGPKGTQAFTDKKPAVTELFKPKGKRGSSPDKRKESPQKKQHSDNHPRSDTETDVSGDDHNPAATKPKKAKRKRRAHKAVIPTMNLCPNKKTWRELFLRQ